MSFDEGHTRRGARHDPRGVHQTIRAARAVVASYVRVLQEELDDDGEAFFQVEMLFADLDPAGSVPDRDLADAAIIYARSCADGHDHSKNIAWATYARDANERLRGPLHPRTVTAIAVLAEVYETRAITAACRRSQAGLYGQAAEVYRSLIDVYEQRCMPVAVDQARVRLAVCGHASGGCGEAIRTTGQCWQNWCRIPQRWPADGCEIAGRYTAMLRLCHRSDEADAVDVEARRFLGGDFRPGSSLFDLAAGDVSRRRHEPVCARNLRLDQL
ncbi:hypothetical protein [Actinoplanes aureus]|uniref:Uncharacterized protein n=1 Tax=Actinoplanes aureus TaxID=2792083 RepID=A0A931CMR1_9ACTN|nr:hypothetical protein [Actinoplanes aureus]MBG0569178.1 hypothetical protein [Actinoplanes aureus]